MQNHCGTFTQWNITQQEKGKLFHFATTWMDLEKIMLNELANKRKKIPHDLTDMWNLMNKIVNRSFDTLSRLTAAGKVAVEGWGGGE